MTSWVTWGVFVAVATALGVVASYFSVRTVRLFTAATAIVLVVVVTEYGLTNPAVPPHAPQDLQTAFAREADTIAAALFHPVWLGHDVPEPGRVGWIVLAALLLIGYRQLEARAVKRQAPVIDTSQLDQGQPSVEGDQAGATDGQRHDQLAAELKFRLAAMEVRSPAILPGGSRSDGLASIAEDSGVTGAGLAGAIIRYLPSLWPAARRFQLRVWVEPAAPPSVAAASSGHGTGAGGAATAGETRVTVELDDPRRGVTVASKTVAAASLNETASMVAGFVARQVFVSDPTTPPWCYGASDGHDLGALLIARQERVYAENWDAVRSSRLAQIKVLQTVTGGNRCAGLVRYELAQLHDLGSNHLTALHMHAVNREQYPRFFRGRYRLGMSLEMAANRGLTFGNPAAVRYMLTEVLQVLHRCGLTASAECTGADIVASQDVRGHHRISDELSMQLLEAARSELRLIRRRLAFPAVLWAGLVRRSERTVWRPHRQLRYRQSFRDGACVAELLVAVRIQLNETGNLRPVRPSRYRRALRVAAAITGDSAPIKAVLRDGAAAVPPPVKPAAPSRERVRVLPWLPRTASWQAAYNTACLYSVLAQHGLATEDRIVVSLQRAIDSKDSEMERPYDWIAYDPDFLPLKASGGDKYPAFKRFLRDTKRRDYPRRPRPTDDPAEGGSDGDGDADDRAELTYPEVRQQRMIMRVSPSIMWQPGTKLHVLPSGVGRFKFPAPGGPRTLVRGSRRRGNLRQLCPLKAEAVRAVSAAEKARVVPVDEFVREELYPGYKQAFGSQPFVAGPLRPFSAADNARYWLRDSLHFSEGMVPASMAFLDDAQTWGAQLGAEIVGVPPTLGSVNRLAGTHVYIGTIDVATPWQVQARAARFGQYVAPILADFDSYWSTRAGELQAAYDHFDNLDLAALDREQLWATLQDTYAFHRRAWFIHFEVMYVLTANYLAFYALAEEIGLEGSQVSSFLAGEQTFYSRTDEELWRLAARARDLGIDGPLRTASPGEAVDQIRTMPNGAGWLSDFNSFLATFGQRTEETCRIDTPSWIEDPTAPLVAIGSFLSKPTGFDFHAARAAAVAERDAQIEAARRAVSGGDLQRFNEALASNRAANFAWWNEEHNYLIDRRAAIPARRVTLELGARLAADGVLDSPDDMFYLFKPELFGVMNGAGPKWPELTAMIGDRRAYFAHWRTRGPELPTMLGTIPDTVPDPIMVEVFGLSGHFLQTLKGNAESATEIRGFPAAKGVAEGTAKVITTVADISKVEPGDILVCGGTTTEWTPVFGIIAACVCDTGGSLTHAAIVSREYGIPCVVGTAIATQVIKTGDRIRVDGRAGTVQVFG